MTSFNTAASLLPLRLCGELLILPQEIRENAEEIRLRSGKCISVNAFGKETECAIGHEVTSEDMQTVLEKASGASVHSVESGISAGYVSVKGGIRVGLCGTGIMKGDKFCGIRSLSSVSVRIPREIDSCAKEVGKMLKSMGFPSTLIISPPGYGKTTCLRSLIKLASYSGKRVSVADERGELAAIWNGEPQFDLGPHTDVMTAVPKAQAISALIRAMNPEMIAMDEISDEEDIKAALNAVGCGVDILAAAHAADVSDMLSRPIYRELIENKVFKYALVIRKSGSLRSYSLEELTL